MRLKLQGLSLHEFLNSLFLILFFFYRRPQDCIYLQNLDLLTLYLQTHHRAKPCRKVGMNNRAHSRELSPTSPHVVPVSLGEGGILL